MSLDPESASFSFLWNSLSDVILAHVMEYIEPENAYRILTTFRTMMTPKRQKAVIALRSCWQHIPWNTGFEYRFSPEYFKHYVLLTFRGLHTLEVGSSASDDMMEILAELDAHGNNKYLPLLNTIRMQHSCDNLTDSGLLMLAHGEQRRRHLSHVDITACNKTTYQASLRLRNELPNLKVLRRIPRWMEGSFQTNFEDDGEHVYYADGSFQFKRNAQSKGFVHRLVMWDRDVKNPDYVTQVGDTLQFIDPGTLLENVPGLASFFRPGVSLLRLGSDYNTEEGNPTVLVVQSLRGTYPPSGKFFRDVVPTLNLHELPTGISRYIDRHDGTKIRTERPGPENDSHYLLVTRMRRAPLGQPMPPPELIHEIRRWCDSEEDVQRSPMILNMSDEEVEQFVHLSVAGGDKRDKMIFQTSASSMKSYVFLNSID